MGFNFIKLLITFGLPDWLIGFNWLFLSSSGQGTPPEDELSVKRQFDSHFQLHPLHDPSQLRRMISSNLRLSHGKITFHIAIPILSVSAEQSDCFERKAKTFP